jgi:hypothetical protein
MADAQGNSMARSIVEGLRIPGLMFYTVVGLVRYLRKGITTERGFHALLRLHCWTNGLTTDAVAWLLRKSVPKQAISRAASDVFSSLTQEQEQKALAELKEDGLSVLPVRLPADLCERLRSFARTMPSNPWNADGRIFEKRPYDPSITEFAKFQFDQSDLAQQPDIQELMADTRLLEMMRQHLQCLPVVDDVNMWWSLPTTVSASEIAQQFHFDYDRTKWIKMFVYLTDVTEDTGPHVFVRHSHKREPRRAALLKRGYVRISDEDIIKVYGREEIMEVCGPAGTVLLVDTSGFHKGKPPFTSDRLIFEVQFSNCIYGAPYPELELGNTVVPKLEQAIRDYSQIYSRFKRPGPTQ